jgi:hypothetical protein
MELTELTAPDKNRSGRTRHIDTQSHSVAACGSNRIVLTMQAGDTTLDAGKWNLSASKSRRDAAPSIA